VRAHRLGDPDGTVASRG